MIGRNGGKVLWSSWRFHELVRPKTGAVEREVGGRTIPLSWHNQLRGMMTLSGVDRPFTVGCRGQLEKLEGSAVAGREVM